MMKTKLKLALAGMALIPSLVSSFPSVYPTGTLIYKPEKAWGGYNLIGPSWWGDASTYMVDMNGKVVKEWKGLLGHSAKILPGGHISGQFGTIKKATAHVLDWDGNVIWKYDGAYNSHDINREGNPVGYYTPAPNMEPKVKGGRTLLNAQFRGTKGQKVRPEVMEGGPVEGNFLLEVDWEGNILWEWDINDHIDQLGLDEVAREALHGAHRFMSHNGGAAVAAGKSAVDWAHINAVSWVGPNKWYDEGDERFHPDNILWTSRNTSIIAITSRKTGEIVWKMGPDYDSDPRTRRMGPIIGSHGAHIIPVGLPGAGNLLVFDNGGWSGVGDAVPGAPHGLGTMRRHYSRVLEVNPVTLEVVWEYSAEKANHGSVRNPHQFFSPFQSNAQRLPNGNTLITEAAYGRMFEVTEDLEIVWEFVESKWRNPGGDNPVFRGYRVPYDWVPQLQRPEEVAVTPPEMKDFRFEGRGEKVARPVVLK